jgi:hypothetical protein
MNSEYYYKMTKDGCSCGAIVAGTDENTPFVFINQGTHSGVATYTANVCADRLGLSSFMLVFVDTDTNAPNTSFTFTSTSIQSVVCFTAAGNACQIVVFGLGLVTGEVVPRQFTVNFLDNPGLNDDIAIVTDIAGFVSQMDIANLPPGSVTALGCGTI